MQSHSWMSASTWSLHTHVCPIHTFAVSFCLFQQYLKESEDCHPAGFHNSKQRAPPKFPSFIRFQSFHEPLGFILGAGGLEGYICSGTIYRTLLLLQTWQSARGGLQLGPPGVLCLHPTPLWWSSPKLYSTGLCLIGLQLQQLLRKDITILRSRLNEGFSKQHFSWHKTERTNLKLVWPVENLTTAMLWLHS